MDCSNFILPAPKDNYLHSSLQDQSPIYKLSKENIQPCTDPTLHQSFCHSKFEAHATLLNIKSAHMQTSANWFCYDEGLTLTL